MKSWEEIAKHDTEQIREFKDWLKKQPRFYRILEFERLPIQDIYGWLLCFVKEKYEWDLEKTVLGSFDIGTPKKLMEYRANKFFDEE